MRASKNDQAHRGLETVELAAARGVWAGGLRNAPNVPRNMLAKPLCSLLPLTEAYELMRITGRVPAGLVAKQ